MNTRQCLALAIVGIVVGCAAGSTLTPKTGPGTEYPCGVDGLVCTTNGVPNHSCCLEGEACGARDYHTKFPSLAEDPSCAPGACCDERQIPVMMARRLDGGTEGGQP